MNESEFNQLLDLTTSENIQDLEQANNLWYAAASSVPSFSTKILQEISSGRLPDRTNFFAFVFLKNYVANAGNWNKFTAEAQLAFVDQLFHMLRNSPNPNSYLEDIFSSVFLHEWTRNNIWPDSLWERLFAISAWTVIRQCLESVVSFRLPRRRLVVQRSVTAKLPFLFDTVIEQPSPAVLRTLCTCFEVIGTSAMNDFFSSHEEDFHKCIAFILPRVVSTTGDLQKCLSDLLHSLIALAPESLRKDSSHTCLQTLLPFLSHSPTECGTVVGVLSAVYNLLPYSQVDDSTFEALLFALVHHWMPLEASVAAALFGPNCEEFFCDDGVAFGSSGSLMAQEFWDLNAAVASDYFLCLEVPLDPRKTAEFLLYRLISSRSPSEHFVAVLANLIDPPSSGELVQEAALRGMQLMLMQRKEEEKWAKSWSPLVLKYLGGVSLAELKSPLIVCRYLFVMSCVKFTSEREATRFLADILLPCLATQEREPSISRAMRLTACYCLFGFMTRQNVDLTQVAPGDIMGHLLALFNALVEPKTKQLVLGRIEGLLVLLDGQGVLLDPRFLVEGIWQQGRHDDETYNRVVELMAVLFHCILKYAKAYNWHASRLMDFINLLTTQIIEPNITEFLENVRPENTEDMEREIGRAEGALRLWCALLTETDSIWCQPLKQLMPLLGDRGDFEATMVRRLKTTEQVDLFLRISDACLGLGVSPEFLAAYTEGFWCLELKRIFVEAEETCLRYDVDVERRRLALLSCWCSQLLRFGVVFSPSVCAVLVLKLRGAFLDMPPVESTMFETRFRLVMLRLFAQIAAYPSHWNFLASFFAAAQCGEGLEECVLALSNADPTLLSRTDDVRKVAQVFLESLIDNSDAFELPVYRRCAALAAVFCIRNIPPSADGYVDNLDAIVSLCVQALFELDEDKRPSTAATPERSWFPPVSVATAENFKASLRSALDCDAVNQASHLINQTLLASLREKMA